MAKLIISRGTQVLQTVQLGKECISLGRHRDNDIVLDVPTVSGHHAMIMTILDDSHLEDLSSTNGTFVNGHRVGKHFLQHKDTITVAKFQLQFLADGVRPVGAAAHAPVLGQIHVQNGANAGKQMVLSKPQTTLGRAGVQVVVISRHHDAYAIAHVEGERAPLLNGAAIGKLEQPLCHGDSIDLDGTLMKFTLV